MKKQLLDQIIKKKSNKDEFAIITNIANGESCIFEKNKPLDKSFEEHSIEINKYFNSKKNGIIEGKEIFVVFNENWGRPLCKEKRVQNISDPAFGICRIENLIE